MTVAVVLGVLLTGCTGGLASAPAKPTPSTETTTSTVTTRIECDSYVGTSPPAANYEVVLGVVALPSSPTHPALQTAGGGTGSGPLRLYAKTGLIVRSGTTFELIVPPRVSDHLRIGWGGGSITPSQRVAVSDCPAQGRKGWLAYVGGYWIDHPACVPLIVKVGTREQQARIGLGTPCPGQQRPQSSTDQ